MSGETLLSEQTVAIWGELRFHSETGSEGGWWALQKLRLLEDEYSPNEDLIILQDGDHLTIYTPPERDKYTVWIPDMQMRVGAEWDGKDFVGGDIVPYSFDMWAQAIVYPPQIAWEGVIDLQQINLFTEDAYGMWLHQGPQKGFQNNEWAEFFMKEWPAVLERSDAQDAHKDYRGK